MTAVRTHHSAGEVRRCLPAPRPVRKKHVFLSPQSGKHFCILSSGERIDGEAAKGKRYSYNGRITAQASGLIHRDAHVGCDGTDRTREVRFAATAPVPMRLLSDSPARSGRVARSRFICRHLHFNRRRWKSGLLYFVIVIPLIFSVLFECVAVAHPIRDAC